MDRPDRECFLELLDEAEKELQELRHLVGDSVPLGVEALDASGGGGTKG